MVWWSACLMCIGIMWICRMTLELVVLGGQRLELANISLYNLHIHPIMLPATIELGDLMWMLVRMCQAVTRIAHEGVSLCLRQILPRNCGSLLCFINPHIYHINSRRGIEYADNLTKLWFKFQCNTWTMVRPWQWDGTRDWWFCVPCYEESKTKW